MKKATVYSILFYFFSGLFLTLGTFLLFTLLWFFNNFGKSVGMDAIIFTLFSDLNGTDSTPVIAFLLESVLPTVLCSATLITLLVLIPKVFFKRFFKDSVRRTVYRIIALALSAIFAIVSFERSGNAIGLFEYIQQQCDSTELFDTEYVHPKDTNIKFPEKKRNLVYIYLESMEISFMDTENGGALKKNVIPELTSLAKNHTNFSHRDGVGGALTPVGTTWTIAATIAQTSGVPLCLPNNIWNNGLGKYSLVLPGLTTLSDILDQNGYNQALMMGSDATFAGQGKYYSQHGTENIYDYYTAQDVENLLPYKDYHDEFWGIEDHYLYEYAKEVLTDLSKKEEPFAFTMFTIDTHSPSGNICLMCRRRSIKGMSDQEKKNTRFEDVLSCASCQINDFVEWLSCQPFYENTTVIIVGDHNSMNNTYFSTVVPQDYTRRVYNCIINAPIKPTKEKNRDFTTFDMFPTTLAALGCTIEGDRLGLGVNLYSDEQTLCERYGIDYLNKEISKASPYYDRNFLYGSRSITEE